MNDSELLFGSRLRELREEKGLTQEKLGEMIGVSANAIGQFERGKINPNLSTISKMIEALDIDANLLFDRDAAEYSSQAKWVAKFLDELDLDEKITIGNFFKNMSKVLLSQEDLGGEEIENSDMR